MSQTIHILPDHVANQIAAGEVIQRPASVVKELMENAVDAGATSVEVHVLDAGRTSIQVVDNGSGMSAEDARLCFVRHATSKLSTADDLFNLATKGFRGEALASIAAIAHVEVTTCQEAAEVGVKLTCHGSELTGEEPKARAVGTTFHVKNLFYNVPARRNFLKSDAVELRHVVDEFQRVAFAHPGLSFSLTHQGNNLFSLKPGTLRQRVVGILGPKHDERLVPVQEDTDVVKVEGFVGKPDSARRTRGEQFLFVNGRFVKHGLLHRAIVRSYEELIAEGSHPLYALYLTVDPARLDVNIHPTKIEVKFDEEQPILAILKSAVKRGLGAHNVSPTLDFDAETGLQISDLKPGTTVSEPRVQVNPDYNPFRAPTLGQAHGGWSTGASKPARPSADGWKELYQIMDTPDPQAQDPAAPAELDMASQDSGLEVLQWQGTHLMVPTAEGLCVVHIRRAHMRVLFERYLAQETTATVSQTLLVPEEITLSQGEVMALVEVEADLKRMGLDLRQVDAETVAVHAVPSDLASHLREAIDGILESYHDGQWEGEEDRRVLWAKQWAKRTAMSGQATLPLEARRNLVQALWACDTPSVDPMGRVTQAMWSGSDIQNLFN